jgi:hypothetical protein
MQPLPGREAATKLLSFKKRHGRDMLVWHRRTGSNGGGSASSSAKKYPRRRIMRARARTRTRLCSYEIS